MQLMRPLFGPSSEEIWRQLAAETNSTFIDGGIWRSDKVIARHAQWVITLEVVPIGKTQATRIRAPYVNPDGFHFEVYRKGIFSDLAKSLGMQDVTVDQPFFDRDFIIKGNDQTKLRQLFANDRIRSLINAQPNINFAVKDASGFWTRELFAEKPPDNLDILEFMVLGVIKDKDRLRLLFDLFAETLDELCRIGSAYNIPAFPQNSQLRP